MQSPVMIIKDTMSTETHMKLYLRGSWNRQTCLNSWYSRGVLHIWDKTCTNLQQNNKCFSWCTLMPDQKMNGCGSEAWGRWSICVLTMTQSGSSMSFRRWQELVVTELAPAHHSRENNQRSLTTHRFTVTFFSRSSLSDTQRLETVL